MSVCLHVSVCYVYMCLYIMHLSLCYIYMYLYVCMHVCVCLYVISACVSVHMLYMHAVVPGLNIRLPVSRAPSVTGNSLSLSFTTEDAEYLEPS